MRMPVLFCSVVVAGVGAGCTFMLDPYDGAQCNGANQCPEGYRCVRGRCGQSASVCGDYSVANDEACDDGNRQDGDGCNASCESNETCGNEFVDNTAGEICDDGTLNGTYGHCTADCHGIVECGDGIVQSSEEGCDDGEDNGLYDHCREDCQGDGPHCGDGTVDDGFETCEPGQGDPCQICKTDCSGFNDAPTCGDGMHCTESEVCDDGFTDDCGSCNHDCSAAGSGHTCGDGELCPEFEECDDGFTDACGSCNIDCSGAGTGPGLCGDGSWCPEHEECDDGFQDACGTCNIDCSGAGTGPGSCGDGDHCPELEECDDGYQDACGTCNSTCAAAGTGSGACGDGDWCPEHETCDDGYQDVCGTCNANCSGGGTGPGSCGDGDDCPEFEECDDGYQDACGTCSADCSSAGTGPGECGDDAWCPEFEACDDGNTSGGDACAADCSQVTTQCGDSAIQAPEICDDGNPAPGDMCSEDCRRWVRTFGGPGGDGTEAGVSVAVDELGAAYLAGTFVQSVDFDPGPGTDIRASNGEGDAFVTKFTSDGNRVWTKTFGGPSREAVKSIAIAADGSLWVTGFFHGTVDFDPGPGVDNHTAAPSDNAFLMKLGSDGSYFWTRTLVAGFANIVFNGDGKPIVSGQFGYGGGTIDLDPGPGVTNRTAAGLLDTFVMELDANGSLVWVQTFGSPSAWVEPTGALGVASDGSVVVGGGFVGTVDFDPGAAVDNHTSPVEDWYAGFVVKVDNLGSYQWAYSFGAPGADSLDCVRGLTIDAGGSVIAVGEFMYTVDFDPGAGTQSRTSNGSIDAFVLRLTPAGLFSWVDVFGGTGAERATAATIINSGKMAISGTWGGTVDFDPGAGTLSRTAAGATDVFLSDLDATSGSFLGVTTIGGTASDGDGIGRPAWAPLDATLVIPGLFSGTVDFGLGGAADQRTAVGSTDVFVAKWRRP